MNKRRVGKSGMVVSEICLGTMTFGSAVEKEESFRIMDRAVDGGIDFFDTAEIYPVPPMEKWMNRTEEIVGEWLKTKDRHSLILATKVVGPGHGWFVPPIRNGKTALDRHHIITAIEGSLRRLNTDYIDLYQTHWPDHGMQYEETMEALDILYRDGKIRYAGSSNETSWGLMKSLWASERAGTIRYESIQNNFSMLNRRFEDELAQVCRQEQVSLFPYSPLAGGVLTGKYNGGKWPDGARFSWYRSMGERQERQVSRFVNEMTLASAEEFNQIANSIGMSLTTLAVAWSMQHDYVASTMIGATHADQLEDILKAADVLLDEETLQRIDKVTNKYKYPMG